MGYFGCKSVAFPAADSRPYHATPAFTSLLWAAYSHTIRPPRQNPVTPGFAVSPWPSCFAHAAVASRSPITRASGTFDTALPTMSCIAGFDTSP